MQVTPRSRLQIAFQNLVFVALLLGMVGLLAWASTQYQARADWTYGHRNSLSLASVKLLGTLTQPLTITAYARENSPYHDAFKRFFAHYQEAKPDLQLVFVDPDREPERVRHDGITAEGQVILEYGGRGEKMEQVNEASVADTLQRLARSAERFVVFLAGDGERNPRGDHNFDLGDFGKQLTAKGFKIEPLSLAATPTIPSNTSVLVIAAPQAEVFPGMVKLLRDYVRRGGNLLWLGDPGPLYGLDSLAADLKLHFGTGTLVDPNIQLLGISDPTITVVAQYPATSPLAGGLNMGTLFPGSTSVDVDADSGWQEDAFLQSLPRTWLETGQVSSNPTYDPARGDRLGPITLGVALTREVPGKGTQRVVVTGDGDFLSNAYLGNGGNLDLGLDIMNWVAHDDSYININPRPAPDLSLSLTPLAQGMIGFGFLFALPLGFFIAGIVVWLRRRRR